MNTLPLIDRALAVLDEIGAPDALPEVRALRTRLAEVDAAGRASGPGGADELRSRLVRELADGDLSALEAGEQITELARREEAYRAGRELFDDVAEVVEERLEAAAKLTGDGWVLALRPAVDRLAEALGRAAKLTDGQLGDVADGNGTPAQRSAVEGVSSTLPVALRAQDVADELRRVGFAPSDALAGAPLGKWTAALRWEDATPLEREADARRTRRDDGNRYLNDLDQAAPLIRLHRDRGAVPALLTAAEAAERPGEGRRYVAEHAERVRLEEGARAHAREKVEEARRLAVASAERR